MVEAKIECLCAEYRVPDLGLHLRRGQIVWLDAAKVRASVDVRIAQIAKALGVTFRKRCTVSRPQLTSKQRVRELHTPASVPSVPAPAPTASDMANEFRKVVREEIKAALNGGLPSSAATPALPAPVVVLKSRKKKGAA